MRCIERVITKMENKFCQLEYIIKITIESLVINNNSDSDSDINNNDNLELCTG